MRQISLNLGRRAYEGTILEGELYENTLLLYDGLIIAGSPVGHLGFIDRYDALEKFTKTRIRMKSDAYRLVLKTFFVLEEFRIFMEHHLPTVEQEVDGIILTPVGEPVRTGTHEKLNSELCFPEEQTLATLSAVLVEHGAYSTCPSCPTSDL